LYYGPNNQGYTGVKANAGRYREVDALGLDGVTAIHQDKAGEFAPACWMETKLAHKDEVIADLLAALSHAVDLYGKPGGPWNVPSDPGSWIALAKAKGQP